MKNSPSMTKKVDGNARWQDVVAPNSSSIIILCNRPKDYRPTRTSSITKICILFLLSNRNIANGISLSLRSSLCFSSRAKSFLLILLDEFQSVYRATMHPNRTSVTTRQGNQYLRPWVSFNTASDKCNVEKDFSTKSRS